MYYCHSVILQNFQWVNSNYVSESLRAMCTLGQRTRPAYSVLLMLRVFGTDDWVTAAHYDGTTLALLHEAVYCLSIIILRHYMDLRTAVVRIHTFIE